MPHRSTPWTVVVSTVPSDLAHSPPPFRSECRALRKYVRELRLLDDANLRCSCALASVNECFPNIMKRTRLRVDMAAVPGAPEVGICGPWCEPCLLTFLGAQPCAQSVFECGQANGASATSNCALAAALVGTNERTDFKCPCKVVTGGISSRRWLYILETRCCGCGWRHGARNCAATSRRSSTCMPACIPIIRSSRTQLRAADVYVALYLLRLSCDHSSFS